MFQDRGPCQLQFSMHVHVARLKLPAENVPICEPAASKHFGGLGLRTRTHTHPGNASMTCNMKQN